MEQRDHGIIFFSEMMKMFYGIFKEQHDINMIHKMIETYGNQTKNNEKQINKEIMIENGYNIIWDSGHMKFQLKK